MDRHRPITLAATAVLTLGLATACNGNSGTSSAQEQHAATSATTATARTGPRTFAPVGTIPLKILNAHNAAIALAPVTIDGKGPFVFAVDTGASSSLVDASVAKQLGLAVSGSSTVNGVACSTSVGHAHLTQWRAGSVTLPADTVVVTNLPGDKKHQGLQGLIGSDVLRRFGAVTLDYAKGRLSVGARAAIGGPTTNVQLKVVTDPHTGSTLALVPVSLAHTGPFRFALDTGAATTTIDTSVAHRAGLSTHASNKKVSGVACSTTVREASVQQWHAGDLTLPSSVVDVQKLNTGNLQGLLGSNILRQFGRITVDYAHQRLQVPKSAAASASVSVSASVSASASVSVSPSP